MRTRELVTDLWVPRDIEEVFPFFADPSNLEELTPPWLHFEILTPGTISPWEGTLIDYRLSVRGVPVRWRAMITKWEPPYTFVDEQVRGPYRYWRHEHVFEKHDGGTVIRDRVRYRAPGWILEPLIHHMFVRAEVERIFAYRRARLSERFGAARERGVDAERGPVRLPRHETAAPPRRVAGSGRP